MSTCTNSVVYCIGAPTAEFVKIGISNNPYERLSKCQVGNPADLELLHTIPGGHREEQAIHWLFAHLHVRGEWFVDPDGEIVRWFSDREQLIQRLHATPEKLTPVLSVGALGTHKAAAAQQRAKRRGRKPGRPSTIEKHYPKISDLYAKGLSQAAIGIELGLSTTAMRKAFKALGLKPHLRAGLRRPQRCGERAQFFLAN